MTEAIGATSSSVMPARKNPDVLEIVKTQNGTVVEIPVMIGSTTHVKPLRDGTYEVTTKGSKMGAEPQTVILTESELIARYGNKTGKNLQVMA